LERIKTLAESELIQHCLNNEVLAQNELYRRFAGKMMGVCLRYAKNRDDAKDILQDGFVRVYINLKSFKGDGSFEGWIKRIMINTAIKHYHKNLKFSNNIDIEAAYDVGFDNNILGKMAVAELMQLVHTLPDGYRTVFNLYIVEGYQHNEIAEMLGISEGTSKSQLARARNFLIKLIQQNNGSAKL
jgi:RNA polymerase sigma-70 factor (ECF subfamily)